MFQEFVEKSSSEKKIIFVQGYPQECDFRDYTHETSKVTDLIDEFNFLSPIYSFKKFSS